MSCHSRRRASRALALSRIVSEWVARTATTAPLHLIGVSEPPTILIHVLLVRLVAACVNGFGELLLGATWPFLNEKGKRINDRHSCHRYC
jgi:hypothetical protein